MKHIIVDKQRYINICDAILNSLIYTPNYADLAVIKDIKAGCELIGTQLVIEDYEMRILLSCFRMTRRKTTRIMSRINSITKS